jgi:hypothetical protein
MAGYAQPLNSDRPGLAGVPTAGTGSGAAAPAIGDEGYSVNLLGTAW